MIFFWKLECAAGKYPFAYIYISQKGGYFGTGFLFDRVAPFIDIYVLNEEGKFKYATVKYLKKLFSTNPSLQHDFISTRNNFTNKVKKEFLIRFNMELSKSK